MLLLLYSFILMFCILKYLKILLEVHTNIRGSYLQFGYDKSFLLIFNKKKSQTGLLPISEDTGLFWCEFMLRLVAVHTPLRM